MRPKAFYLSREEVPQLFRAWLAISFAFAILLNRGLGFNAEFLLLMAISSITVGVGFLLHELAHKVLALRYGCRAEFRSFDSMLLITIAMSFFGFIIAAPGAVFIQGRVNAQRNGLISAAGPVTNIFLALVFLAVMAVSSSAFVSQAAYYGMSINTWLAIFNMLPFFNLDGTKVFAWSKPVYFAILGFAFVLMVFSGSFGVA